MKAPVPAATPTRQRLADLAAPLREERERVLQRIAGLSAELAGLREDLADIDAVLKRLDPEAVPAKLKRRTLSTTKVSDKQAAKVTAGLREVLALGAMRDGFTKSTAEDVLRERGVRCSPFSVTAAIDTLRESGEIRLDRKLTGGGRLYKLVGPNGASDG